MIFVHFGSRCHRAIAPFFEAQATAAVDQIAGMEKQDGGSGGF